MIWNLKRKKWLNFIRKKKYKKPKTLFFCIFSINKINQFQGISESDAKIIVDIISKNHETFVDIMMVEVNEIKSFDYFV